MATPPTGPNPDGPKRSGFAVSVSTEEEGTGTTTQTGQDHRHTISVRIAVKKPEPFSVTVSSTKDKLRILSIKVKIFKGDKLIYETTIPSASPFTLEPADKPHLFPVEGALPHLQVGNVVEVDVTYLPEPGSKLQIGVVGEEDHHSLGHVIKH
jgi:hypothetical protein